MAGITGYEKATVDTLLAAKVALADLTDTGSQAYAAVQAASNATPLVASLGDTPEAHGAKGDYNAATGVGTDDTVAIQDALNAAVANGGVVRFGAKHYKITSPLSISDANGISLVGTPPSYTGPENGSWISLVGATAGTPAMTVADSRGVQMHGIGFDGGTTGDGIHITSDNAPISTRHSYHSLYFVNVGTAMVINQSGASTQSDQIIIENVRVDGFTNAAFTTDSDNVTGVRWVRCTTACATSDNNTIHYNFLRGSILQLETCFGAYAQDFVRIAEPVLLVDVCGCQCEGSTNASPSFIRAGAAGDAGNTNPTTMRNCSPDFGVVVAGPSRRIVSISNLWHSGSSITLSGGATRFFSIGEDLSAASVTVTGTNAMLRAPGADLTVGGNTPALSAGANGSTALSVTGNTYTGRISFTTAAGLAVDAYAVILAPATQIAAGYTVCVTPGNAAAAESLPFVSGLLASQWSLSLHNPPAAATPLVFYYRIS